MVDKLVENIVVSKTSKTPRYQKDYLIFFVFGQKYYIEESESWLFQEIECNE